MKLRKGFTLVELLIVIVIIGILAGGMLLSSSSATDSAEATNIISNMRSLKSACAMLYADNMEAVNAGNMTGIDITHLATYMDNPQKVISQTNGTFGLEFTLDAGAAITTAAGQITHWWVTYRPATMPSGISSKLKDRAEGAGLFNTNSSTAYYDQGDSTVWIIAR